MNLVVVLPIPTCSFPSLEKKAVTTPRWSFQIVFYPVTDLPFSLPTTVISSALSLWPVCYSFRITCSWSLLFWSSVICRSELIKLISSYNSRCSTLAILFSVSTISFLFPSYVLPSSNPVSFSFLITFLVIHMVVDIAYCSFQSSFCLNYVFSFHIL